MAGYTVTIAGPAMEDPVTIESFLCGGAIRSVTISNSTAGTSVDIHAGSGAAGNPLFSVRPGMWVTLPIMSQTAVSVRCTGSLDGTVFVHADIEPMTATGLILR